MLGRYCFLINRYYRGSSLLVGFDAKMDCHQQNCLQTLIQKSGFVSMTCCREDGCVDFFEINIFFSRGPFRVRHLFV